MSELPPEIIDMPEADEHDQDNRRKGGGIMRVMFGVALVANTFGLVFVGYHVFGRTEQPAWLDEIRTNSQRIENMESTLATVQNIRTTLDELAKSIEQAKTTLRAERTEELTGMNFRMNSLDERMDAYDEKLAELLVIQTKQKKVVAAPRKQTISTPKINMQLISLRSAGGYELVSLINPKGEQSPLLRNGDTWQGWEFLRADNRTGTFRVNGREVTLVL